MAQISVSVQIGDLNLKSLVALAKLDLNRPGDQIRMAIERYLQGRGNDVQKALEEMEKDEVETLKNLFEKSE